MLTIKYEYPEHLSDVQQLAYDTLVGVGFGAWGLTAWLMVLRAVVG